MSIEHIVRIIAGSLILISLAIGVHASPIYINSNFLWFTAFVGGNLFQSGFTGFCPLEMILKKFLA